MNPYFVAFWILLVLGAFIFVMNWAMLLVSIRKHKFHSLVPFFGGLFLAAAIYVYPTKRVVGCAFFPSLSISGHFPWSSC